MPYFRPSLRHAAANTLSSSTREAARNALKARSHDNALPILPSCPAPTCACADMPPDLDIDRSTDLNSTMAPYSEHLIVSSGQADWKSKIEQEKGAAPWGDLVANVKSALSLKGQFHNPYYNVVVSTSSFSVPSATSRKSTSQALLFPSFRVVNQVEASEGGVTDFVRTFLLPETLHAAYDQHSEADKTNRIRDPSNLSKSTWKSNVHPIFAPTILICSHNSRDRRCGILGPLLHAEFCQYINKRHTLRNLSDNATLHDNTPEKSVASHHEFRPDQVNQESGSHAINVGMISHIGGHKFAGNVIIYIPPGFQCRSIKRESRGTERHDKVDGDDNQAGLEREDDPHGSVQDVISPLAGKGIWYGRVEPRHVEGIVEQTIYRGRIIKDLFRGGISQDGSLIRLPLY